MPFLQRNFATGYLILAMSLVIPLSGAQEFSESSSSTGGRTFYRPGEERIIVPGQESQTVPAEGPFAEPETEDPFEFGQESSADVVVEGELEPYDGPEATTNPPTTDDILAAPESGEPVKVEFPPEYAPVEEEDATKPAPPEEAEDAPAEENLFVQQTAGSTLDTIMLYVKIGIGAVALLGGGLFLLIRLLRKKNTVVPPPANATPIATQPQVTPMQAPRLEKAMEAMKPIEGNPPTP